MTFVEIGDQAEVLRLPAQEGPKCSVALSAGMLAAGMAIQAAGVTLNLRRCPV